MNRRTLLEKWWLLPVGATVATFGYLGLYAARVTRKSVPGAPQFGAAAAVRIANLKQVGTQWADVPFSYGGRPCVLLRIPAATRGSLEVGGQHYAAFSRICTHLGCTVNVVRDTEVLAFSFNYRDPDPRQQHPMLGCPCHFSVFDPLKSGEAVFGKAHLPLPRVRLEQRGNELWATGIEAAPQIGG
ncbi:ubiquinol-cytochrome c reductase iron-sulfur subunit [Deinococcus sp. KNUC1210]|uniref:QcrA and Rieske domain-containing protein n=1 Tax=Deinococcus sp. KNUC1210 TaxID=2917691 RepID=UPI001EEFF0E8|nr:ubiquinol-cytochrome c reductase iron-sulfur subunit [Deinococcus sp. KNUC1210]ULH16711.1 ubiquinol-cytochrome c reductase iron-sulfur subunit [Deinococcus sp. KNUC1210]